MSFRNSELNFRPKGRFNHLGTGYKSKAALFLLCCLVAPGHPKSLVILMVVTTKFFLQSEVLLCTCRAALWSYQGSVWFKPVQQPGFLPSICSVWPWPRGRLALQLVTITEMTMEQHQSNDCRKRLVDVHKQFGFQNFNP